MRQRFFTNRRDITFLTAIVNVIEHARTHAGHLLQAVLKEAFSPSTTE